MQYQCWTFLNLLQERLIKPTELPGVIWLCRDDEETNSILQYKRSLPTVWTTSRGVAQSEKLVVHERQHDLACRECKNNWDDHKKDLVDSYHSQNCVLIGSNLSDEILHEIWGCLLPGTRARAITRWTGGGAQRYLQSIRTNLVKLFKSSQFLHWMVRTSYKWVFVR